MTLDSIELIRGTGRIARKGPWLDGWPSFAWANYGNGPVWGTYLLPNVPWAHFQDIPVRELPRPASMIPAELGQLMWGVTRWAVAHGFKGALPTCEMQDYHDGRGVVYGAVLFHNGCPLDGRDVPT